MAIWQTLALEPPSCKVEVVQNVMLNMSVLITIILDINVSKLKWKISRKYALHTIRCNAKCVNIQFNNFVYKCVQIVMENFKKTHFCTLS